MNINIAQPYIGEEEEQAVLSVLRTGQLAQGEQVAEFESRFAEWLGTRHAVAVSSGTTALHLALLAHGIGPGDEVITTPFSFIASANAILYVGATPVFADIEPDYYTLDPLDVERKITGRTRAIIAVHLYGQPCEMTAITSICSEYGLALIEDACQAHGARYQGRTVGTFDTGCFSFYPTKNMTTGEGGMITTDDDAVAENARYLRQHGMKRRYHHDILGFNFRMTNILAAIGIVQLGRVDGWNRQRQINAAYLTRGFDALPQISTPRIRPGAEHVFHQYTVRVPDREHLVAAMTRLSVGVGVYYPVPIHHQTFYASNGHRERLVHAEMASRHVLSLPVHPALTEAELDYIIAGVMESVHHFSAVLA